MRLSSFSSRASIRLEDTPGFFQRHRKLLKWGGLLLVGILLGTVLLALAVYAWPVSGLGLVGLAFVGAVGVPWGFVLSGLLGGATLGAVAGLVVGLQRLGSKHAATRSREGHSVGVKGRGYVGVLHETLAGLGHGWGFGKHRVSQVVVLAPPPVSDIYSDDPREVLGVSDEADEAAIKRAYHALALQYHPDKNPHNTEATVYFQAINEAYRTLMTTKPPLDERIVELKSALEALIRANTQARAEAALQQSKNQAMIHTLSGQVEKDQATLQTLSGQVENNQATLQTLSGQMEAMRVQRSEDQAALQTLNGQVEKDQATLQTLSNQVENNNRQLAQLLAMIAPPLRQASEVATLEVIPVATAEPAPAPPATAGWAGPGQ